MTDRALLQQALEALEADEHDMVPDQEGHMVFRKEAAITALRERLAQPEQSQPLTDEEIRFIAWGDFGVDQKKHLAEVLPLARAIEAKLREKNNG